MKPPRVKTWMEPIDADCSAACACVSETYRGTIYGASAFLLIDTTASFDGRRFDWRSAARKHLVRHVAEKHHGSLPVIGHVRMG